jgi:trehalose 6-phosphate synthase/phosphatase
MLGRLVLMVLAGGLCHLPCPAQRSMAPGDPNLSADWDWTVDQPQVLFHHRPGQAPGRVQAQLPFFAPGHRLYQSPGDRCREDGWLLAHRDFGTEEAAPAIPYFTLYNKYRGVFRVVLWTSVPAGRPRLAGTLEFHPARGGAGQTGPLFTFSHAGKQCFRSDYDPGQVEVAFSDRDRDPGWAVFDFPLVGYDPDLGGKDPLLRFTLHPLEPAGDEPGGLWDAWLGTSFAAPRAELGAVLESGGSGYRYYPTVRRWCETETARMDRGGAPLEPAFQLAATDAPGSCAPLVAALGGKVNGWLGGTHLASPWEPISYQGQVPIPSGHGLPGPELLELALRLHAAGTDAWGHRPVQEPPWGIFNFEAGPVLAEHPEDKASRRATLAEAPLLHVNPEADLELLSVSFEASIESREPGAGGPAVQRGLWPISPEQGPSLSSQDRITHLVATLRFRTRKPTREADGHYTVVRRLPWGAVRRDPEPGANPPGSSRQEPEPRLLLVSNRVPWTVAAAGGVGTLKPSAGGLATALARTHERSGTRWVGWPGELTGLDEPERRRMLGALEQRRIVPVEITAAELASYYEGYCNGGLWPLCHSFLDKVRLDSDQDWAAYEAVNLRFAQAAAAQAAPGGLVWVHDYQLMLVPQLLRGLRPDLRIGFFLHIPFPAFEVFRTLPRHPALLRGVLGADLAGFQTREHQAHFARAAGQVLGADPAPAGLRFQGRTTALGTYGIGVDAQAFARAAASPAVLARAAEIRGNLGGRPLVLGVDRLDYTKGILPRLLAIRRYLERHPDQRGRFLMVQVAVPSREGVQAYRDYRRQVDELTAQVNGAFGTPGWVPIHLLHQGFPFEEVVALYLAAQVLLVTSEQDGMNLVAKEFCATRGEADPGVLVLSERAGAAQELGSGAILVNPYDIGAMAEALDTALRMPEDQARARMRALRGQVAGHDVHRWAEAFVRDLEAQGAAPDPAELAGARRVVLYLDYDGTLVPFAPRPEEAGPDPGLLALLERLAGIGDLELHLVSGRPPALWPPRRARPVAQGRTRRRLVRPGGVRQRLETGRQGGPGRLVPALPGLPPGGEEPFPGLAPPPGPAGAFGRRPGGPAGSPGPVGGRPGPGMAGRGQGAGTPGARSAQGAGRGRPRSGPGHAGAGAGRRPHRRGPVPGPPRRRPGDQGGRGGQLRLQAAAGSGGGAGLPGRPGGGTGRPAGSRAPPVGPPGPRP